MGRVSYKTKTKETPESLKTTAIAFIVVAMFCTAIAVAAHLSYTKMVNRCTEDSFAVIQSVSKHYVRSGRRGRRSEYTFTGHFKIDGVPYTVTGKNTIQIFEENDLVKVCYDPDDPSDNYLPDCESDEGWIIFILAGILYIMGIATILKRRKMIYKTNPGGQTFEEWQAQQQYEMQNGMGAAQQPGSFEQQSYSQDSRYRRYSDEDYFTGHNDSNNDDFLGS